MSRTHHLTSREADDNSRATRRRAKTRLTKLGDRLYWPNADRPKNAGNAWRYGFSAGQRHRKEQSAQKVLERRLERRRLNRMVPR